MPEHPWIIYRMSEGPLTTKEVHQGVNEQLNRKLGTDWGYSEYEWANLLQGFRPLPIRTASGTIAHFTDGADDVPMKSVVANIVPIQDLHGYSKPWAAGAGKNKFDKSTVTTGAWLNNNGGTNSGTNRAYSDFIPIKLNQPYYVTKAVGLSAFYTAIIYDSSKSLIGTANIQGSRGASGSLTFTEGAYIRLNVDESDLDEVQFELGSTATSYEPYANVCPISGTDELTLNHKGKNLFDPSTVFSNQGSYICAQGIFPRNTTLNMSLVDKDPSVSISGIYFGFVDEEYVSGSPSGHYRWVVDNGNINENKTNIAAQTQNLCNGLLAFPQSQRTIDTILSRFDIQVELGTTPSAYEAFTGSIYTFDLGQEIMGGTADVVGGTGEETHGIADLGDSSNNWSYVNGVFYSAPIYPVTYLATYNRIVCSIYKDVYVATSAEMNNNEIRCYSNRLYIKDSRFSDVASFVEGIAGEKVCYELATPTPFTFTGQPINSYLGVNNVWTDSGEVLDVEYRSNF